jgi:5-hydroxyisourate hydrolase
MPKLSTHVLDTSTGKPAAGVRIDLFRIEETPTFLKSVTTNADGRVDAPLLEGSELTPGLYQLIFYAADYFAASRSPDAGKFLQHVPIVFRIDSATTNYHIPLLLSPWSYTTYRGS